MKKQKLKIKELELEIRSWILSVAQESKTKYKESKILLEDSKYWQIHIVSLTSWVIYQKFSKGIFLLRMHFSLLENDNPFQLVPGYGPGHTLGTGGQELHICLKSTGVNDLNGYMKKEEHKWNHLDVYLDMYHPELLENLRASGKGTVNFPG
ncbi:hypothetical protein DSO57_1017359 [Entomophthora muscae]|uniref:Uncharacterized protein n=1 Tax=Entomophthora muscae TaxID=34485 RepID=A0ACC2T4Y0_9FUNG|nr:hypothetical protein DSO57_1017359 [Entomophthora muscae]